MALVGMALAFLALVALGGSWLMTRGIVELTGLEQPADVVPSTILSGGLVLSTMVSFTVALAALYLSADLDLLLSAPVPRRAVFASKLLGGLLPTYLAVAALMAVPLWGHGLAMGYGLAYVAAVVLALVLLPLVPAGVGALAVMLIVRRVSAHRLGEVVGLIVAAMTISLALVVGSSRQLQEAITLRDLLLLLDRFRNPLSPAEWLTSAVVAAGRGQRAEAARWFGLAAAVSAAALMPLVVVAERLYYDGWAHMQSADRTREATGGRLPWNRVDKAHELSRASGILCWLPTPVAAVMRKDLRVTPRDLTNMAQVLSPLAIGVFFVLQQLLYPVTVGGAELPQPFVAPLMAMLSAALAAGASAMITARFGLTAFSAEGRGYWVLKAAPVRQVHVLAGKYLTGYLPYLAGSFSLVVLLEAARAFSNARGAGAPLVAAMMAAARPELVLYAWFVVAVLGAGVLSITLAIGTARPNMSWDTPHEMLTPDVGCLSLVLYGAYLAVVGPALALPMAASGFPVMAHSVAMWVVGLVTGLGVTAVVVVGCWRLALAEVDAIGE